MKLYRDEYGNEIHVLLSDMYPGWVKIVVVIKELEIYEFLTHIDGFSWKQPSTWQVPPGAYNFLTRNLDYWLDKAFFFIQNELEKILEKKRDEEKLENLLEAWRLEELSRRTNTLF